VHNFNPADFTVNQVFYPSKDGTQVPMFVIARKDFVPDGSSPCLLYGYGGFSISLTPSFNLVHTFFVQGWKSQRQNLMILSAVESTVGFFC
jgi:prolyl oligopeptidase